MLTSQLKNTFALLLLAMCCYTNSVVGQNLLTPDSLRNKIVQLETKGDYNEISRLFKKYYETYTESQKWENLTQLEVLEVNILRRKNQFKKAQKFIHSTLEQANKTLDVNSKILALTYKTAGDLYVDDLRLFDQGLIYYQLCMSIEMEQDTGFNKDLVIAYNNLGVTFKLLGKFEEADSFHRKALELIPNDEQEFLRHSTLINLGETKFRVLEYDSAQYYLQKALDLWVASELPMVSKNLAFNYLSLAQVLTDKGDFDLAIELNLKALAIYQVVLDPDDVSLAELYMELSYVYQKKNNFTLAIQYTNQAADIFQKKYGKDHPDMASIHHSLGHIYYNQSQYFNAHLIEKSIEHYKELLRNDSINYPELDKPFVAVDFHAIGLAYKFSGNYKKALSYIKATFNLQRKIFGEESLRLINTINNIGAVYVDLKKYDSARFYFNQALFICKKKEQELPLDFINIHKNFADVFLFEEKYSEAINSINKSLQYFGIEPSANGEIELPPLDSIKFKNNLIYVLPRRAKALLGLYNKTKDPTYLDLTLNNDLQLTQIYIDIIQESNSSDGQLQQIPTLVETY